MNRREKQVAAASLRDEAKVLREVRGNYEQARKDITDKIEALLAREQTQSVVWQVQYQESLRSQIDAALDALESRNYSSIHDYLENEYSNGYIGAMYDLAGQGIPFALPIDQTRVAKMVETGADGIKLSRRLYGNTTKLKNVVRREVSVGLASAESFQDIAARITRATGQDYGRTFRIARTEGGRVSSTAQLDALEKAKKAGADIVKQWDSVLDNRTRPAHRQLDGQVRELDEPFEVDGFKARCPHDFGKPWLDINCRCRMNQRARWALDEDELETLRKRAEFYGLDKTKDFEDFRARYIQATSDVPEVVPDTSVYRSNRIFSGTMFTDSMRSVWGEREADQALTIMYDRLDDCPIPSAARLWESCVQDVRLLNGDRSFYSPHTGRVTIASAHRNTVSNRTYTPLQTLFHEVGHAADDVLSGGIASFSEITSGGELGKAIFADWEKRIAPKMSVVEKAEALFASETKVGRELWDVLVDAGEPLALRVSEDGVKRLSERIVEWVEQLDDFDTKARLRREGVGDLDWILKSKSRDRAVLPQYLRQEFDDLKLPRKGKWLVSLEERQSESAFMEIYAEMQSHSPVATNNLSDWLECLTLREYPLGFGHGTRYWTRQKGTYYNGKILDEREARELELSSEAFAECFDSILSNRECWELMQEYFPSATKWFIDKVEELVSK